MGKPEEKRPFREVMADGNIPFNFILRATSVTMRSRFL
jgi:hypothetical protein